MSEPPKNAAASERLEKIKKMARDVQMLLMIKKKELLDLEHIRLELMYLETMQQTSEMLHNVEKLLEKSMAQSATGIRYVFKF